MPEKKTLPDWTHSLLAWAFLEQIYSEVRAISAQLEGTKLKIVYYLDRDPTEFDDASMDEVATYITAGDGSEQISDIEMKAVKLEGPLASLDRTLTYIYARREHELR